MTCARAFMMLALVAVSVALASGSGSADGEADKTRSSLLSGLHTINVHDRDASLRSDMRALMTDDEDDGFDPDSGAPKKKALLQTDRSMDAYMKEATQGLSSALGPRWDSQKLEEDANANTRALLQGIGSPKRLGAISQMMGAMQA